MSIRTRAGTWCLLLVTLAAFSAASVTGAPAASAHAVLRSTSPAAGSSLATAPAEVALTFDEPPFGIGSVVQVTGPNGTVVSVGKPRIIDDTVHQTLATGLGGGRYRVDWKVTSDDGHPVSGTFRFTLTTPPAPTPSSAAPTTPAATSSAAVSNDRATRPWPVIALAALVLLAAAATGVSRSRNRTLRKKP